MHQCKCSLQIPVRQADSDSGIDENAIYWRKHKKEQKDSIDNYFSLQILSTPNCSMLDRSLVRAQRAAQMPSTLRFDGIVVFRIFIGFSVQHFYSQAKGRFYEKVLLHFKIKTRMCQLPGVKGGTHTRSSIRVSWLSLSCSQALYSLG